MRNISASGVVDDYGRAAVRCDGSSVEFPENLDKARTASCLQFRVCRRLELLSLIDVASSECVGSF